MKLQLQVTGEHTVQLQVFQQHPTVLHIITIDSVNNTTEFFKSIKVELQLSLTHTH